MHHQVHVTSEAPTEKKLGCVLQPHESNGSNPSMRKEKTSHPNTSKSIKRHQKQSQDITTQQCREDVKPL